MSKGKAEGIRRQRFGDIRRILRDRYKHTLPDDDAGREDLHELLLPISLGPEHERKMQNAIETWAPWMAAEEAGQFIDRINRTPVYLRKPTGRELGERIGLQNWQREALHIRTIRPIDMTDEQLLEQRKAKARKREQRRRLAAGRKTREAYLASALSRKKPWEVDGIGRRTWERRRASGSVASPCAIKLLTTTHTLATLKKPESPRERGLPRKKLRRKTART